MKFTSGFKSYDKNVPLYLHNRPKIIIDDILDKMGKTSPEMISSVKPIPSVPRLTYHVEGSSMYFSEKISYKVELGDNDDFPSCSCAWYRRKRSLCKHFMAVFKSGFTSFNNLSTLYLNHPLHILDSDLFGEEDLAHNDVSLEIDESPPAETDESSPAETDALQPAVFEELPKRQRAARIQKMSLLSKVKELTELCHNILPGDSIIEDISLVVETGIELVHEHLKEKHDYLIQRPLDMVQGKF